MPVVDTVTNTDVATIQLKGIGTVENFLPGAIALAPDGKVAYVTVFTQNFTAPFIESSSVSVGATTTNTIVGDSIPV